MGRLIDVRGCVPERPLVGEFDCRVSKASVSTSVNRETSARRWPKDQAEKSLQPTVYLYAYRQLHGADAPMRFLPNRKLTEVTGKLSAMEAELKATQAEFVERYARLRASAIAEWHDAARKPSSRLTRGFPRRQALPPRPGGVLGGARPRRHLL